MSDKKISQLTLKATLDGADEWVIVDSGTAETKKVSGFDQKLATTDDVQFESVKVKVGATTYVDLDSSGALLQNNVPLTLKGTGFFDGTLVVTAGDIMQFGDPGGGFKFSMLTNFDMVSTTGAPIVPRMTTAQKNAIAVVANGMIIYDSTLNQFQKYENSSWASTEGAETFAALTDVSGAYTTVFTLYRTNAGVNGLEETTVLLQEPAANQFSFGRGTSLLLVQDDLTIEGASFINQDVTTDSIPTFDAVKQTVHTDNVSNPPTDAELDAIYGTPATVGAGFTSYIDDNGGGANFYQVTSDGTNWWTFAGTKAV